MIRSEAVANVAALRGLPRERLRGLFAGMPPAAVRAIVEEWFWQARGGQIEPGRCPDGKRWRVWALVAGRGFGKTRAGAEWVWQRARENPGARIALLAGNLDEVAKVMVEGESGLLAIARRGEQPRWRPARGTLEFPSGAVAFAYSAARPDRLRGPQHHFAWCDELAKWPRGDGAWDNLMFGLRLGERPRTIVTTTPQPGPLLKRILALPRCHLSRGRTDGNPDLARDAIEALTETYGGTRLGRQELEGILFDDLAGALWTRDILERGRAAAAAPGDCRWLRIVVGVDPPATADGDSCGIVVCGLGEDRRAFVLADLTVRGLRPEGWARRVTAAAALWGAHRIVAEKNQGGEMVASVLRGADPGLPVRLVHATRSKAARAEPIALRFETGAAGLAGRFPELEEELCAFTHGGYAGEGSPDRADAMVWAMTALCERRSEPPHIVQL